ncbi:MAG TPA: SDR family oxidoreductase [Kofleriaceae bacterium]|nr:SDR family oxidoreductase [Kofleriaceae bacterium]
MSADQRLNATATDPETTHVDVVADTALAAPGEVGEETLVPAARAAGTAPAAAVEPPKYPFFRGDPIDVAYINLFLISDESRMITGATIQADGGRASY